MIGESYNNQNNDRMRPVISNSLNTSATQIVNLNQARSVQEISSLLIREPINNSSFIKETREMPKKRQKKRKLQKLNQASLSLAK